MVLWTWLEHLRERWADLAPQQQAGGRREVAAAGSEADAALAAELQAAELLAGESSSGGQAAQRWRHQESDAKLEAAMAEVAEAVVHGEPCTEKRSTFQARQGEGGYGGQAVLHWACFVFGSSLPRHCSAKRRPGP